jgi:hypothetical protein
MRRRRSIPHIEDRIAADMARLEAQPAHLSIREETVMSDTDIRFAKLVKIIERLTKVIENEVPETQLMAAMGLVLTVANSHDKDTLVPVFKSFVAQFEVEAKAARPN